ncbi:MAG: hypothetical protein ACXADY_26115 [Candidatus Hodarchaeales archaeon]
MKNMKKYILFTIGLLILSDGIFIPTLGLAMRIDPFPPSSNCPIGCANSMRVPPPYKDVWGNGNHVYIGYGTVYGDVSDTWYNDGDVVGYGTVYGDVSDTWYNDGDVVWLVTESSGYFPTLTHRMKLRLNLAHKIKYRSFQVNFSIDIWNLKEIDGSFKITVYYANGISETKSVKEGMHTRKLFWPNWIWFPNHFKVDYVVFSFAKTDGNMLGYSAYIDFIRFFK